MNIQEVHLVTFSPTRTSRQAGEAIVRGTGIKHTITDLTLHPVKLPSMTPETLAVITVPVYGGHVAPLALERMQTLQADGTPAVAVVVYGNRAYEKALAELDAFITGRGFKVIAGGTFIGEHSYSSEAHPIAPGRPDAADLEYAEAFGQKIRAKIEAAPDLAHLYGVDINKIFRPRQPFLPLMRFFYQVIRLRKSGTPLPRTPFVDERRCNHCGYCAAHCPTGAIASGEEARTMAERCIRCCACVKGCPQGARTYDTPFATLLARNFRYEKENRIIL